MYNEHQQTTKLTLKQRENIMLIINGKKFARNKEEFTNSLFKRGGTCIGFYRVNKNSITLMDMQKNKVGVIINKVLGCATKQDDGKYWYSYADIPLLGVYNRERIRAEIEVIYSQYDLPIKY